MTNKRAAMFGLDARIALAIFGALSVITGAALYSAIQNAKATSLLTQMQEIGKAWEQYYLDTGTKVPVAEPASGTDVIRRHLIDASYLIEDNGVQGWKGPYLQYNVVASNFLDIQKYGAIDLYYRIVGEWTEAEFWRIDSWCITDKNCGVYVQINGIDSENMAISLDKKIDKGDGSTKGSFRWFESEGTDQKWRYFLLYTTIKNPNN